MSLIISLEDALGKEVNMEVLPDDSFQKFLERASNILGYEVNTSCISGENEVSPTDNVYDYLLKMAALDDVEQQASDGIIPEIVQVEGSTLVSDLQMATLQDPSEDQQYIFINSDVSQENHEGDILQTEHTNLAESAEENLHADMVLETEQTILAESGEENLHHDEDLLQTEQTILAESAEENLLYDGDLLQTEQTILAESAEENEPTESPTHVSSAANGEDLDDFEKTKMENDLLTIINKSAGVVKTFSLGSENHVPNSHTEEEHLEEVEDEMEEGEVIEDSVADSVSYMGSISSNSNYIAPKLKPDASFFHDKSNSSWSSDGVTKHADKPKNIISAKHEIQVKAETEDYEDCDEDFTDIEFLDEEILQEDLPKQIFVKEETKEPDLEDDIDAYTIIKKSKSYSEKGTQLAPDPSTEMDEISLLLKVSVKNEKTSKKKEKPVYTRQELLDLLESASDSDMESLSKKVKAEKESKSIGYIKQEKLNKNEFSKEFERIAKMGVTFNHLPVVQEPVSKRKRLPKEVVEKIYKKKKPTPKEETENFVFTDHIIPRGYPCRLCNKIFDRLLFAITHTMVHKVPDKLVYPCVLCSLGFPSYPEVRDHMKRTHHKGKNVETNQESKKEIKESPQPKKSSNKGKSANSTSVSATTSSVQLEMAEVKEEEEWFSDASIEILEEWLEDDAEHGQVKDEVESEEMWSGSEGGEDFVLDEEEWVPPKREAEKRVSTIPDSSYNCTLCRKNFKEHAALSSHTCLTGVSDSSDATILVVANNQRDDRSFETYRCAMCGQAFPTPRRLVYHRSVHQAELLGMDRACQECEGEEFESEVALYDHINLEHNQLFMCHEPGCSKVFQLRSSLKIHGWVHGKKRLKCDVCLKQFPDSQTLKDHKTTHLKVKPFQCHICLKFINRRNRLRMHLLAHEAKPSENSVMSCRHCHMAFRTVSDARDHIFESETCRLSLDPEGAVDLPTLLLSEADAETSDLEKLLSEPVVEGAEVSDCQEDCQESTSALVEENISDISAFISGGGEQTDGVSQSIEVDNVNAVSDVEKDNLSFLLADSAAIKNEFPQSEEVEEEKVDEPETYPANFKTAAELLAEIPETLRLFIEAVQLLMVFRCEFCEKVFCSKESLNDHRIVHKNKELPFECNVCQMAFGTFARVTSHKVGHGFYKLKHTAEGDIEVQDDGEVRERSAAQVIGYDKFPVVKYFLCQMCERTFLHHTYYSVHVRKHHSSPGEGAHICPTCKKNFSSSHLLRVHLKRTHGNRKRIIVETDQSRKMTKPVSTNYRCLECNINFTTRVSLIKHLKEEHHVSEDGTENSGRFKCNICHKNYHTKAGLQGHIRTHKGLLYLCALCGSGFSHQAGLATHHKRVHLRSHAHGCDDCGQSFFSLAELNNHIRNHTGEKPFPCPYCSLAFRTKGRRREHVRVHTGERPFPCDICGLAFRRNIAMKNHRLIHTGHRPHVCEYCGKRFHIKSALRSHHKMKHSTKFLLFKIKGGDAEKAALEECLNSLVVPEMKYVTENTQILPTISLEGASSEQMVLSVEACQDDQQTEYILYHKEIAEEDLHQYQMEATSGDDGQIRYQLKLV